MNDGLLQDLKDWRLQRARADGIPAYVVFHDTTLGAIAERRPASLDDLLAIRGIGPAKLERYGEDVLRIVLLHI
jgi:ATP-dependent DNA helicase RecQ